MNHNEALKYLITTLAAWPTDVDEAPDLPEESGWWWRELNFGDRPVALANDDFDRLTREEWSRARREALGRPTDWPAGARILVQNENGMWIFGTMEHAEPVEDGGWNADIDRYPGTWLNEGQAQGSTDIAGWYWHCSLVTRDDAMLDDLDLDEPGEPRDNPCDQEPSPEPSDIIEPEWMVEPAADSHYASMVMRIELTEVDRQRGYAEIRLDPYRMADFYGIGGGPREQVFKKAIRGTSKGHSELQVIDDIRAAIDRWEQMVLEGDRIRRV